MFTTPRNRISVVALAALTYLLGPITEWNYLRTELLRGRFPVNVDSIVLGLFRFGVGWLFLCPLFAIIIWLSLRSYPGRVPLFGFNNTRPIYSLVWSVVFAIPAFNEAFFAVQSLLRHNLLDVIEASLAVYLILSLRSSIVFRPTRVTEDDVSLSEI